MNVQGTTEARLADGAPRRSGALRARSPRLRTSVLVAVLALLAVSARAQAPAPDTHEGAATTPIVEAAEGSAEATEAHEAKPIVPPTVWAILSFAVVLFIIAKKLMPPITGALDERARAIREALQAAEAARSEAEAAMKRHQDDLERARQEARAIIEEGKSDAEKLKARIVSDAQRESEEIAARARREIELAKHAALDDLHRQSVGLAFELASRLVHKSLDTSEHQQLIQEQIQSFQAGAGSAR